MLLHKFGLIWAIVALVLVIACTMGLLTRNRIGMRIRAGVRWLFDFSASEQEGRQIRALLTETLAASQTDAEFERCYKQASHAATGLEAELSWAWLCRSLMDYRQINEFEAVPRTLAERFLRDIPRRYRLKDE